MLRIDEAIGDEDLSARMLLQIHDELVFEVNSAEVDPCRDAIAGLMTSAAELDVALEVDAGLGLNWNEAH